MAATTQEVAQFLAKVPLFHGLNERQLIRIAKRFRERDYKQGDVIVEQNTIGVGLFIVARGEVKVERKDLEGNLFVLDRLGRTDFFGEMSLLEDSTRTASVIAESDDVKCIALSKLDLMDELEQDAIMAVAMLKTMAARFRRTIARM